MSDPDPSADTLDNLGELPRSYGTDAIFLVAQEPHWLFTYWDIDIALHPGGKTFLRVREGADHIENEIEVPFETRNWYIPVQKAGSDYSVEIGYYRGANWNMISGSITVRTPQDKISESGQFDYATIPLHMSFHHLMEHIQSTIKGGETLIQALGRLQREGKLLAFAPGAKGAPGPDERVVLEALLGKTVIEELSSSSLSSEELTSRIHSLLQERLSSASASEILSSGSWGAAESSLFSAISALAGTTSWSTGALSSWAAAALTSWAAAARSSWTGGGESRWTVLIFWPRCSFELAASSNLLMDRVEPVIVEHCLVFKLVAGCRLFMAGRRNVKLVASRALKLVPRRNVQLEPC